MVPKMDIEPLFLFFRSLDYTLRHHLLRNQIIMTSLSVYIWLRNDDVIVFHTLRRLVKWILNLGKRFGPEVHFRNDSSLWLIILLKLGRGKPEVGCKQTGSRLGWPQVARNLEWRHFVFGTEGARESKKDKKIQTHAQSKFWLVNQSEIDKSERRMKHSNDLLKL